MQRVAQFLVNTMLSACAVFGLLLVLADVERRDAELMADAMAQRAQDEAQVARSPELDAQLRAGCEMIACERMGVSAAISE